MARILRFILPYIFLALGALFCCVPGNVHYRIVAEVVPHTLTITDDKDKYGNDYKTCEYGRRNTTTGVVYTKKENFRVYSDGEIEDYDKMVLLQDGYVTEYRLFTHPSVWFVIAGLMLIWRGIVYINTATEHSCGYMDGHGWNCALCGLAEVCAENNRHIVKDKIIEFFGHSPSKT